MSFNITVWLDTQIWKAVYQNVNSSYFIFTFFLVLRFTIKKNNVFIMDSEANGEKSSQSCFSHYNIVGKR